MNDALKAREQQLALSVQLIYLYVPLFFLPHVRPYLPFNIEEKRQHFSGWTQTQDDVITRDPSQTSRPPGYS